MRKSLTIAKFEYLKIVKRKSFWFSTLFFPLFLCLVMFVSGYSSVDSAKKMEDASSFDVMYIVDDAEVIPDEIFADPFVRAYDVESVKDDIMKNPKSVLIHIPSDFRSNLSYEIFLGAQGNMVLSQSASTIIESVLKSVAMSSIEDQTIAKMIEGPYSASKYFYDENGEIKSFGFEKYILPIASIVVFFLAVFISSSYMLNSVSSEKENRMIETMLSMVDKKSLMIGKMIGLTCVAFTQFAAWIGLGLLGYIVVSKHFGTTLPFSINWADIDWSMLPLNIFLIIAGFVFFNCVMIGVGAVGTGIEDSKSLSSVFIILSIFPLYLLQSLITQPDSLLAKVFSFTPFTSFMTLLLRNSFGTLTVLELGIGIGVSVLYSIVALYLSYKLFEIGCLMYNRRPTLKEVFKYIK